MGSGKGICYVAYAVIDWKRRLIIGIYLNVQYAPSLLRYCDLSSDIMNNKVFYQHPNLMRVLGMHETVMEVMVNVLGGDKSQVCATLFLLFFLDH